MGGQKGNLPLVALLSRLADSKSVKAYAYQHQVAMSFGQKSEFEDAASRVVRSIKSHLNKRDVIYSAKLPRTSNDDMDTSDEPIEVTMLRALSSGPMRYSTQFSVTAYNLTRPEELFQTDYIVALASGFEGRLDIDTYYHKGRPHADVMMDFEYE